MSGTLSETYANLVLNFLTNQGALTPPATLYLALTTEIPSSSDTATTIQTIELSGGGYQRQPVANDGTFWSAAAEGSTTNQVTVTHTPALTVDQPPVAGWALMLSQTPGDPADMVVLCGDWQGFALTPLAGSSPTLLDGNLQWVMVSDGAA